MSTMLTRTLSSFAGAGGKVIAKTTSISSPFRVRRTVSDSNAGCPSALGDVVVGLQDRQRLPALVPPHRPAARDDDARAIALSVSELPLPAAGAQQLRGDVFKRFGKRRLQQRVRGHPDGVLPLP